MAIKVKGPETFTVRCYKCRYELEYEKTDIQVVQEEVPTNDPYNPSPTEIVTRHYIVCPRERCGAKTRVS